MARKGKKSGPKKHDFRNKLILNQWLISLFGIDPLIEHNDGNKKVRPFHVLAASIKDPRMEGLDESNLHKFYYNLKNDNMINHSEISDDQLLRYEENIVRHTQKINEKRDRPITWKYHQWLTLLFTEIYLDKYFADSEGLRKSLNAYIDKFNSHYSEYEQVPYYTEDDLNKICFQNATGSGKTLIMHVNLLQYRHHAKQAGREKDLSRVILLTPNERLSEQHMGEFSQSGIAAMHYAESRAGLFGAAAGLGFVDVLEITKLADKDGDKTIATRNLGDQNLLLVDEGHRGMSGSGKTKEDEEGAWLRHRNMLCERGFTFEYSATFEQSVADTIYDDVYAKCILFDYSYRYFYEDGFGKDYQILNLSKSLNKTYEAYLTACLLKFYQQFRIYEEKKTDFMPFNLEKPLWVFVGNSVVKATGTKDEQAVASDVAKVIQFIANFLEKREEAIKRIELILTGTGNDTGLLDEDRNDIFERSFIYLARLISGGETAETIYLDILRRLFNNQAGGKLILERIKGDSGEIALKCGAAEEPFGLINVGDALGLTKHCEDVIKNIIVEDSEFSEVIFSTINESSSPINLLIGSKKFVEGWDCWRVSTMGLMHVGKSEGAQIIQLFGRGVRLKGYEWSLKRSGHINTPTKPQFIEELETLNIFGVEADFMERFRKFLAEEGLPGNERKKIFIVPLNVTYDFGRKLKVVRPKKRKRDGSEYKFKRHGPVPTIGEIPDYLKHNTVVSDWYPRIQTIQSRGSSSETSKHKGVLRDENLCLLDYDLLFFEIEQYKREQTWYNLNISKEGIRALLKNNGWYTLYIPEENLKTNDWKNVRLWQLVATELLKRYCDQYYDYCESSFIEPRLEIRDLEPGDDNFPDDNEYHLIVDGSEIQVIEDIKKIQKELEETKDWLIKAHDLVAVRFSRHLYEPLFHIRKGGKIQILPVALNESEYQFVMDLKDYCEVNQKGLKESNREIYLLRNMSRGRGIGFFEAGNFYPDFIMWVLEGGKQYVSFIEPHGLLHEGPASKKIQFHKKIKEIERRLGDLSIILNSFIISWTRQEQLTNWGLSPVDFENLHVFFMHAPSKDYVQKMFNKLA